MRLSRITYNLPHFRFILKTVKNYKQEGEWIFNALMLLQHNRDLKGLFDSIISITLFCFYLKFNIYNLKISVIVPNG